MSSRSTILLVANLVGLFILLPVFIFIGLTFFRNPLLAGIVFVVALIVSIIAIVLVNKFILSKAKMTLAADPNQELVLELNEDSKEVVFNLDYEVKKLDLGKVEFFYTAEVVKDEQILGKEEFRISNFHSNIKPDTPEMQLSVYSKSGEQIILKDVKAGRYVLRSNKALAPAEITISENVEVY